MHEAFLAAPPRDRWMSSLGELFTALDGLGKQVPGKWAAKIVPNGARVALRVDEDGWRELRIYRREPGKTANADDLFRREVDTFVKKFGVEGWKRSYTKTSEGGPVAALYEVTQQTDALTQ